MLQMSTFLVSYVTVGLGAVAVTETWWLFPTETTVEIYALIL